MKRIGMTILIALMGLVLWGCQKDEGEQIVVTVPSGTPLIAIGGVLDQAQTHVVIGPDLLANAMTSKTSDIVIAPIVSGAKLYQLGGSIYELYAIITNGNNYIVSKDMRSINHISDLEGKTIVAYGEYATPGIILRQALEAANVNCEIVYNASVSDAVAPFLSGTIDYILTAEPTLSVISQVVNELHMIDLQQVLVEYQVLDFVPQAGIFVNPESNKQDAIGQWLYQLEENIQHLNENPNEYAESLIGKHSFFDTLGKDTIASSIPRSQIVFLKAYEHQALLNAFTAFLYQHNSNLIGVETMGEHFYRRKT